MPKILFTTYTQIPNHEDENRNNLDGTINIQLL